MSQAGKVFVTGMAALSAGGHDVEQHWQSLMQGQSLLAASENYDTSSWNNQLVGEIKNFDWNRALPDRKLMKLISKQDLIGLHAAIQASNQAGLTDFLANAMQHDISLCDRTGVFVGSPGNKYFQQYDFLNLVKESNGDMQYFAKHLFEQVHPMWLLRILPNNVLAYAGIQLGCKGVNHNFTNHIVGGLQALIEAYWAIVNGQADRILVVAYDIATEPQARFYYDGLGVLSAKQLAPFDKSHDGTVLAEGAAAIVLESEASIKARGVKPIAQMLGGLAATEGSGLCTLSDDGKPLSDLMKLNLDNLGLYSFDIDMVVAHGNGNQKSDDSEALAIAKVFGEKAVPVTAFKSLMGHSLCASGLLDATLAIKSLDKRIIPAIINCQQASNNAKNLDLVMSSSREMHTKSPKAMVINRGFAGMNAVVTFKACESHESI